MGKWSFLLKDDNVRKLQSYDETQDAAQRFALLKAECSSMNFEELSQRLTANEEMKAELSKDLKDVNLNIQVLERLIIEKLDSAGVESIVAGGFRLTPSPEPSFKKSDAQALREWAEANGHEDLLTINAQTLSSLAKDHFLQHGEPMPGVEMSGVYTKLSRTKAR